MPTKTRVIRARSMKQKVKLPPIKKQVIPTTHYYLVLDESGSMQNIRQDVIDAVNNRIEHIRKLANNNQNITISMISFDSDFSNKIRIKTHYNQDNIRLLPKFYNFYPAGGTPLIEATYHAISELRKLKINKEDAILVEIITDGAENTSKILPQTLVKEIERCNKDGYWTITFQVPQGHKNDLVKYYNIPFHNVIEWETTSQGTRDATQIQNTGFTNYISSRAKGLRSVDNYYAAIDMSDLSSKEIKQNLINVANNFDEFEVKKEEQIKPFVEYNTGRDYVSGAAFYQLSKRETVQPYKEILVREKDKTGLYGGANARSLLGLPEGVEIKVDPFNLSKYEIFIESTSVNRLLVRGTSVLVNKYQTQPSPKTTW